MARAACSAVFVPVSNRFKLDRVSFQFSLPRMAKQKSAGALASGGASVPASHPPVATKAREDARPTTKLKPSALVDKHIEKHFEAVRLLSKA
jgi:hypothetical protein